MDKMILACINAGSTSIIKDGLVADREKTAKLIESNTNKVRAISDDAEEKVSNPDELAGFIKHYYKCPVKANTKCCEVERKATGIGYHEEGVEVKLTARSSGSSEHISFTLERVDTLQKHLIILPYGDMGIQPLMKLRTLLGSFDDLISDVELLELIKVAV